jgi:hypothetical protein
MGIAARLGLKRVMLWPPRERDFVEMGIAARLGLKAKNHNVSRETSSCRNGDYSPDWD